MNFQIKVAVDESAIDPRDNDNLGAMLCFHKRYTLGDKHIIDHNKFKGWGDMEAKLRIRKDTGVILPLYLYDHSGITIRTTPFECRYDSGQLGFIYVSKSDIRKEYGVKRITKKVLEKATNILIGEVKEYDDYLTGNVHYYEVTNEFGDIEDSCYNIFGDASVALAEVPKKYRD